MLKTLLLSSLISPLLGFASLPPVDLDPLCIEFEFETKIYMDDRGFLFVFLGGHIWRIMNIEHVDICPCNQTKKP